MRISLSRRMTLVAVFVGLVGVYSATFSFRPLSDTSLNSLQTRALVQHGDVDVSRYAYPQDGAVVKRGTRVFSVYGIGVSLPALPVYALLTRAGVGEKVLQASVAIPYTAAAVLAFLLLALDLFPRKIAVWTTMIFGFGTTMWTIASTAFWQHGPVAFLVLLGLRWFFQRRPVLTGLALGSATLVRPSTAIVVAAIGLFMLAYDRRAIPSFVLGGLPATVVYAVSNRWVFGSFTTSSYSLAGVGFNGELEDSIYPMLFGWWRGLFAYSPVLIVGVIGVLLLIKGRTGLERRLAFLSLGVLCFVLFYGKWMTWWAGSHQFGYRYLLDAAPILCLLIGYAMKRRDRIRVIATPLAVVSMLTMTFGSRRQRLGWDGTIFEERFTSSPIGQAWIDGIDHPLDVAWRLVLLGALAAMMWWASGRLEHPKQVAAIDEGRAG